MSEIKHTFQAGKMNKDLDERLVPQGEYRDALNIEVRTSDGSDVGTAQTLHGNKERVNDADFSEVNPTVNWDGKPSRFVGSVADGKADRAYFFIASPKPSVFDSTKVTATKLYKDMIVMYDNVAKTLKPVVTDIFRVEFTNITSLSLVANNHIEGATTVYDFIDIPTTVGNDNIRPGMRGRVYDVNGDPLPNFSVVDSDDPNMFTVREVKYTTLANSTTVWRIYFTTTVTGVLNAASVWTFEADKVLNFTNTDPYNVLITGINVIDNLLLWTDNKSEPKKVNIDRCIGTVNGVGESFESHSRLKIVKPGTVDTLEYALSAPLDPGLKEEHVTVIRRAPRTSLRLEMSSFEDGIELDINGSVEKSFVDDSGNPIGVDSEVDVEISGLENIPAEEDDETYSIGFQYTAGQIVILENDTTPGEVLTIRAVVISAQWNSDNTVFNHTLRINSIDSSITNDNTAWTTYIEQAKPLFEFNLGRFSYRYKYQDGEHSSFAPWSELAFLPGKLDYVPKKGYNLGMVNTVRYLRVTDFVVDDYQRPDDIVEVDVLYKDTVSPNVRVVKSIRKNVDPEWSDNSDIGGNSGVINISSEMMHRTLPSSQILRAWDNVPKLALAQEVTGNRLVYSNYLQNFNIKAPVVVSPSVLSIDHPSLSNGNTIDSEYLMPAKSLKSIRRYKIGVLFGDKYGRETPVMGIGGKTEGTVTIPSSVSVEKNNSLSVNQLQANLSWGGGSPDSWMEYYKYYVKETTNEYYNLVLHRWYNADDGNAWLAFASADRNKVDEEMYLTLKTKHGSELPVLQDARYKILAIEDEAPDYIKITEKVIGNVLIDSTFPVEEINESLVIAIDGTEYDQQIDGANFKGTGYVRIKAEVNGVIAASKWMQIAQMRDHDHSIVATKPFGESAKLWNHFGLNYSDPMIWSVEVKDEVVESRPEFDGRFFVKVVRDGVLDQNILQTTNNATLYETDEVLNFRQVHAMGGTDLTGQNNGPANQDAAYRGNYAGVEDPSPGALSNDRTMSNWNENNDTEGIVDSGTLYGMTNGCGEADHHESTREFWQNYASGGGTYGYWDEWPDNENNNWFIDRSRIAKSFYGGGDPDIDDLNASARNGLRNSGGKTKIDFSYITASEELPGSSLNFFEHMQSGTIFKFMGDPFDEVYRIESNTGISWNDNFNEQTTLACLMCSSIDVGASNVCYRATYTITIVKVSDNGPLDTNVWDPRSALLHDGTEQGSILTFKTMFSEGSTLDFKEGNAIWETEPKEDIGLDLYYEATDALPIKLSQENIESYCPTESPITVYRPGADLNPVTVANMPVVNTAVRDVVGIRDFPSADVFPFQIALKDNLKFTHADGGATEAEVIDHMHPIPLYANTYGNSDAAGGSEDRSSGAATATYKSSISFTLPCTVAEIETVVTGGGDGDGDGDGDGNGVEILGCMDPAYLEYSSNANVDDGTCVTLAVTGCMDIEADNYDEFANVAGGCIYPDNYCTDADSTIPPNVGCRWNADDGSTETTGNGTNFNGIVVEKVAGIDGQYTGYMVMTVDMYGGDPLKTWDEWYDIFDGNETIFWPSIDQLEVIESMRSDLVALDGFVDFEDLNYWSSSEYSNPNAWHVNFNNGSSFVNSKNNSFATRGIIPFSYTPPGQEDRLGTSRTLTSGLSLVDDAPVSFSTGTNGEKWEAISATNTATQASVTLPVGTFITNIANDNTLAYNTTNGDSIALGNHTITFQKVTGYYKLDSDVYGNKTTLPWFNCYSFGNGLESDRIRDDYNAPQIDNGVKVSTLLDSYGEERRGSGMIYSGIYNSTSGVNNLNEFNMAEKITKDLNPSYGSIQALKTRDTNVVAFCEDKVFKILANKDALYNADGSINLVASDRVLGSATAFTGEYGISSNPESLAVDGYRMYFTDKQRNKVLRLSQDGLTPISDIGMTSWFRDNLNNSKNVKKQELIGTFDDIKGEYNLSLRHLDTNGNTNTDKADITVSFNERSKGWSSFKSFVPETGLSINDEYLTGKIAKLWSHHNSSVNANTFYGEDLVPSTIDVLFNENPGSVKSFLAMNYEGSQAKINEFITEIVDGETYNDGEYYNLTAKAGWYVDSFNTDLQEAQVPDFKQKEGKWFNYISGVETNKKNLDTSEFSVQGIGVLASTTTPTVNKVSLTIRENND